MNMKHLLSGMILQVGMSCWYLGTMDEITLTLPESNMAPKMMASNKNLLFLGCIFRGFGDMLVSGRVFK